MNQKIIKFRAWDLRDKKMIYTLTGLHCDFDLCNPCEWGIENYILMQFTGLLDKAGKEIYEEDIVLDSPPFQAVRCVVEFVTGTFMALYHKKARFITPEVEVIGNIYENPELLKETYD